MSLTCYWKNKEGELEVLKATDYDENLHKDRIFDKFTEAPVFYKKGHERLNRDKKGQEKLKHYVRSHFFSRYVGDFPSHIEFDKEYFKKDKKYSPRESPEHIGGKIFVAEEIIKYADSVSHRNGLDKSAIEFERLVKLPNGKYRIIDVAVVMPYGEIFAHEVQLASITTEEIERRSEDYRSIGIDVVWWLGKAANTETNRQWYFDYFGYPAIVLSFEWEYEEETNSMYVYFDADEEPEIEDDIPF